MRLLVVDDEPAVRASLRRALELDAFDVALAVDGQDALDRLADAPVDAIVLDVAVPRVDGLEVCRRLRAAGDRTPVLMLTARDRRSRRGIDLARGDQPLGEPEDVRLDHLVEEALERARSLSPEIRWTSRFEPCTVTAVPDRIGRAVNNLLDNAAKYGGGAVEIEVARGAVVVRDHGPGVPADELPHLFDRFFRGAGARSQPGSGLGLAIVRQVAEQHCGSVSAATPPGGGLTVRLQLGA